MSQPKRQNEALKYMGLGMQLLVTIAIGVWGGLQLDKLTPFDFPLFLVLLPLLALVLSFWSLMRTLNNKK
ncbi:MAG: AtpZ/AtpI family protein [Flavipsychrobacter sp.]